MAVEPLPSTLLRDRMPDWWRPFALDFDGGILAERRCAIEALREALSTRQAVDAVAFAHGDLEAGERIIDLVRHVARGADRRYDGRVGDAEPPALVAAALADQLASAPDADLSTLISLLVLSAAYSCLRPVIAAIALPDYAARQLQHRAVSARRCAAPAPSSAGELVRDALANGGDGGSPAHPAILAVLARRIDDLATGAQHDNAVLRERLEQLTWARLSWCETADAEWRDVEAPARPLIAAVELTQRTRGIAPPPDAPALLGSVLTDANPGPGVDPVAAVAAAAPHLAGRLGSAPHSALFPLTTALTQWRQRPADAEFRARPELEHAAGLQDEKTIAMQAYREALALRGLEHG
jgi:hypothetical protein